MNSVSISQKEFNTISALLYKKTGIFLPNAKKYLVVHRLMKRLRALKMDSFRQYVEYIEGNTASEMQSLIDNLTTNETFFFREEKHFEFLGKTIKKDFMSNSTVRIWSAACSSGEEVYSIAMVLSECLDHGNWEVFGSDISDIVLDKARKGIYPIERSSNIPRQYLKKYCLKGVRSKSGEFTINNNLRKKVRFLKINLYNEIPNIGMFDVIFLRNTLIYFDMETKKTALYNVLPLLKRNGYFIVSHTESLVGITNDLEMQKKYSSIYCKT
ncbi:MAG: SAM-dependent methyltransferase [Spirochaetes bacterium]|nr:SAM-dependent methyltransferase [Spirochaetota bacterium]